MNIKAQISLRGWGGWWRVGPLWRSFARLMSERDFDGARSQMHPLTALDFPTRVAKRAQYEAFEFTIVRDGVQIRNCSHADPTNHEYLVTIKDRIPVHCECPADRKYDSACKHRVAVAIRSPVLDAATEHRSVSPASDGG